MRNKNGRKRKERKVNNIGTTILFVLTFSISVVSAQEGINATGGDAMGNGGSASYSVGQVFYQTHTGTNGSVAEGVQQPYEISIVTGIEQTAINLAISAYPNPTTDYLTLQVDVLTTLNIHAMSYQLYDMNGKILQSKKITGNDTIIIMSNLVPSTYFVRVIEGNKEVKTFKIIKN